MAKESKEKTPKRCVITSKRSGLTPQEIEQNKLYTKYMNMTREDARILGEKPYVAYYLELMEQGTDARQLNANEWMFDVTAADKELFPELSNAVEVKLIYDALTECYTLENYVTKQG